mmetsp:Transcript_11926/g.27774  ORF Transcript_11926/g.27774 Transcript_11926/m.27774 type:complete len:271 (-) Transcript_11926:239-1051(-)
MGDAAGSPPQGYNGLLNKSSFLNPAVHSVGPSPVMHAHLAAAMQRPWNNSTPVKPKAGSSPSYSPVPSEDAAPLNTSSSTGSMAPDGPAAPQPRAASQPRAAFQNPTSAYTRPVPVPDKENAVNGQEEAPWWDFWPKLSMCAMSQLGCCSGNQGDTMRQRKALCGVGIVFSEANHGALVVQQVVPRSPAAGCGRIEVGDELMTIGSKNVYRQNADAITPLVLGEEGTDVEMTFLRRRGPGSSPLDQGEQIQVTLQRRFFAPDRIPGYIDP